MFADPHLPSMKTFAYCMHKIFKNLYTSIKIDGGQLNNFK